MALADEVASDVGNIRIVDVRPESYYVEGHIPTAINIPFDVIASKDGDVDDNIVDAFVEAVVGKDEDFVVACQVGYHSKIVSDALYDAGFKNLIFYPGSYEDWVLDPSHEVEK